MLVTDPPRKDPLAHETATSASETGRITQNTNTAIIQTTSRRNKDQYYYGIEHLQN